jgi:hypothetical protein
MRTIDIEKRLAALEHELASLKSDPKPGSKAHPVDALERIHNTFPNDESFREAMRLGRKWRQSQRPNPRKTKTKRK